MFTISKHPVSLILIIIRFIITNIYKSITVFNSFWIIIIIIIALVSGIIILFLYISSLTSNFKIIQREYGFIIIPSIAIFMLSITFNNPNINTSFSHYKISLIYSSSWLSIFLCLSIILIIIIFIIKIIYKPYRPLKSSYEKNNKKHSSNY